MNQVVLVGRLTKKPEVRYNANNIAICRFNIAIDRPKAKDKEESETDYPTCVCFNNVAVNLVKYQDKGSLLAISGRLQTGSYDDKDGKKVYTTEVMVKEIQFLSSKNSKCEHECGQQYEQQSGTQNDTQSDTEVDRYSQMSTTTVMNEDYNPELAITDDDLPF